MNPSRPLSRRYVVPGGLLAGLALAGSAFSLPSPDRTPSQPSQPQAVAQAEALPSPLPAVSRAQRASRSALRTRLPVRYVTRDVAFGRPFSGYASWYGGSFQGRRTASGERFNTHALTAASRTLPFGTRLRVCRGDRCVVVRVNDRGPYVGSRVLDLSKAARDRLGSFGVAHVTVTKIRSRRVAVHPPVRSHPVRRAAVLVEPAALAVHPTAAPVLAAVPAASTSEVGGADARLAAGGLLLAGSALTWLRRRRTTAS
jgi:rare lipoprotein A